jgi:hypothetical protein
MRVQSALSDGRGGSYDREVVRVVEGKALPI